jgi:ketosteroid isomerase-like protein
MSEQENVAIVRRGYEAFGRGDVDALLELFSQDVEWITPGPEVVPTTGRRRGREQVREFFRAVGDTFEIQRFEPQTFVAQDDLVIVLGEDTARVKATGRVITEPWVHVFTCRNGKIARFQEYIDNSATMAEIQAAHART